MQFGMLSVCGVRYSHLAWMNMTLAMVNTRSFFFISRLATGNFGETHVRIVFYMFGIVSGCDLMHDKNTFAWTTMSVPLNPIDVRA